VYRPQGSHNKATLAKQEALAVVQPNTEAVLEAMRDQIAAEVRAMTAAHLANAKGHAYMRIRLPDGTWQRAQTGRR
jgi:hypothetical protein